MRIGVLSPVAHGTGASCISLLLALRLGQDSTEKVCLTHVHPSDSTLRDISGVEGTVDKTTTPSMIISTFKSSGVNMTLQEYSQYCASVTREVDLFTCTRSGEIMSSYDDARYLANYTMEKFPHKHVVVDADEHSEGAMLDVIERCDVLVFVVRITSNNIEMLKSRLAKYMKQGVLSGKKVILVFNNYQIEVASQKDLAKLLGVPVKSVFFMPLNPYIAWGTFNRKVTTLWNFISKGDPRVSGVRIELDRMITSMLTQKGKATAKAKKETRLVGVKLDAIEETAKELKASTPQITQSALEHAKSLQQLNQVPVQQAVLSDGLPSGFGAPMKTGFGVPEDTDEKSEQPLNTQTGLFVGLPDYSFPIQPIQQFNAVRKEHPKQAVLSAKPERERLKPVLKPEIPVEQPNKVFPSPVELKAEPSVPVKIERPVVKPLVPALPTAVLKPKARTTNTLQAVLPTTTIAPTSKDIPSKAVSLPASELKTTTLGAKRG